MSQGNQPRIVGIDELRNGNHRDLHSQIEALYQLFSALSDTLENLSKFIRPPVSAGVDFYQEVRQFESNLIEQSLKATGGRQKESAKLLNLNPTTLSNKIKVYNINWKHAGCDGSLQGLGVRPIAPYAAKRGRESEGGRI